MEKIINLLLVEDDKLDIMDLKRSLDKLNILYTMKVANNGEEALSILEKDPLDQSWQMPDIVLIDINMPKMNGLELLQKIRDTEEMKELKCFIITTSEEKVDREIAKELGVSGYIVKPFKLSNPASMDSFNLMIDLINIKS